MTGSSELRSMYVEQGRLEEKLRVLEILKRHVGSHKTEAGQELLGLIIGEV